MFKKTFLFSLMLAALACIPMPNGTVTAAEQTPSVSNELAWHGRWGGWGWGGRWGGYGGHGYYRPYYNNYSPYYYSYPYYSYPYYSYPYYSYPYYYNRYWA